MYKIDLHTHSLGSPDGGLTLKVYRRMLGSGDLDFIAVTDHNSIELAKKIHAELGEKIIIGEEVTAREGELIGLYLKSEIPAGMSAAETVKAIHDQGGLVYVPHPFETVRKGLPLEVLRRIAEQVDIVEIHNGRAIFKNKTKEAKDWADAHGKPMAASSDAHGWHGWGKTYSIITEAPTRSNLPELLRQVKHQVGSPGLRGVLYPKINRLRKKFRHV